MKNVQDHSFVRKS